MCVTKQEVDTRGAQDWANSQVKNTNQVRLEVLRTHSSLKAYRFGIDETGQDPLTYLTIIIEKIHEGQIRTLGWSVYDNLRKLDNDPLSISTKVNNMFVEMAKEVVKTLTVRNCFVCSGMNMGKQ